MCICLFMAGAKNFRSMNNNPSGPRPHGSRRLVARAAEEHSEPAEPLRNTKLAQLSNPQLLAELLRAKIDADFGGSLNKAAKASGVSQPTLYRRVVGVPRRQGQIPQLSKSPISRDTLSKLLAFLGDAASGKAIDAVMSPRASELVVQNDKWNKRFQADVIDDSLDERIRAVSPEDGPIWKGRLVEFRRLWTRLAEELPDVYTDIFKVFDVRRGFAKQRSGRSRQRRSGIQIVRFTTAVYRIFLPLLEAKESGWIERRGHELSRSEFRHFVECGWKREKILLSRAGDLQRAQRSPSLQALALAALPNLMPQADTIGKTRLANGRVLKHVS